jgi:Ca2+-binding EF-hand superfamily protein
MDTPIDSTKNYGGNNDGYISIGEFRNYVNSGIPTYYAELIKSDSKDGQKLLASALDNIERTGSLA